jgi:hypothetical protein
MKVLLHFLRDRLDERSTWVGIVGILSALGIVFTPDQVELVVAAGLAVWGLVEAFLPDPAGRITKRVPDNEVSPSNPDVNSGEPSPKVEDPRGNFNPD